jgi:hypothetical protein
MGISGGCWFVRMWQPDTLRKYTAILSISLSSLLLLYLGVADQLSVTYFHLVYLLSVGFLSIHLVISAVTRKERLAILTAVWVMVCFRLLSTASVPYPIIQSTDAKFELQNVNAIISAGVLPWGRGSGFAYDYSFFPGLEIVLSSLSLVSLIPQVVLLKYAGSFLGIVTVAFFLRIYFHTSQGESTHWLAASLAALSPWFTAFETFMVHQTPAFALLGMLLLSLSEGRRREWIIVALLALTGIVVTHAFTSYISVFLVLLLSALKWLSGKKMSFALPNLTNVLAVSVLVITCAWNILAAIGFLPDLSRYANAVTDALFSPELTLRTITSTGTKPLWVVTLTTTGLVTYFVIAFAVFCLVVREKRAANAAKQWLASGGFLIFGAFLAPDLAGISVIDSLLGRGLTYLQFLTAPLVAQFLLSLCRQTRGAPKNFHVHFLRGPILTASLIFIILAPAVYYGVSPAVYDRSAPLKFDTDLRLSLGHWQAAATFADKEISAHAVYGVRLARDYVGALARKDVSILQLPVGTSLMWFLQQHRGALLFLRLTIIATPDAYARVSESDLVLALDHANILYSSGEVVVLSGL